MKQVFTIQSKSDDEHVSSWQLVLKTLTFLFLLIVVCSKIAYAQSEFTVTGTVVDSVGETLIGVSVKVKGSNTGTSTNNSGVFTLTVPDENSTLEVSYIGFISQEVPINRR